MANVLLCSRLLMCFVTVEEKVVNEGGEQRTIQQPIPLPEGVSDEGVISDVDLGNGWTNCANDEVSSEWMHGVNLMIFVTGR